MKKPFFTRNHVRILALFAFLLPVIWVGTKQALRSNRNDVKSWLPSAYEETTTFNWYWKHFPSDGFILVSWEGCTLDDDRLELLADKLVPPEESRSKKSEPVYFQDVKTGTRLLGMLEEDQGLTREAALERLSGSLIGPDGKQTGLVLTLSRKTLQQWESNEGGAGQNQKRFFHGAVAKIYEVAEKECGIPRDQIHLGGPPVDNVAIDVEGERSLFLLAGASAAVGLLMSWWCLRSWALTMIVFSTALLSAGISLAAVWYSGFTMNAILLTMPSLVYVAATSGAIHLANYYRDTTRQAGIAGAPTRAVVNAWLPLALATGTTAIGLGSLVISELVPVKMFGVYSAIGVLVSFGVFCLFMPSLLELWPIPGLGESRSGGIVDPGLSPKWRSVGEFIIRRHGLVTAISLGLMVIGAYGVAQVQTSVNLMRLFSDDARIIQDYTWLEEHLGPLVPMEVVIRVDKAKSKMDFLGQVQLVKRVQQAVERLDEVGSVLAAPTFTRTIPARVPSFERGTWNVLLRRNRDKLQDYLCTDGNEELWRVSARVHALTNLDYGAFVGNIRAVVEPVIRACHDPGVRATYTGLVPLVYKAQRSLLDGLILGFAGDLILIGVALVFLTREWSSGFLLMLPSLFPLALVFGTMGLTGILVDTGTVMVPAVALGVTVDDAIHFMLWCHHGQDKGMDRRRSIMFAYGDCARAIYQSWGVIGLGLFAFALSSFVPTRRFGVLMLVMLTLSSIATLVFLPALLAGPAGRFFWRRKTKPQPISDTMEEVPEAVEEERPSVLPLPALAEKEHELAAKHVGTPSGHDRRIDKAHSRKKSSSPL